MSQFIHQCGTYIITIGILLLSFFYVYAKYKHSYWRRRGVKTPPTHIIYGNFKDTITFRKPPGLVLKEIYDSADPGDPYIGFYIFHKPILLIRDLDLIKDILIKDFATFPNRRFGGNNEKDSVGLINLLSINQPRWKYLRSKLTPSLTSQKLKTMLPLLMECEDPLLNFIDKIPQNTNGWKELELKEISSRYTTDVISSLVFGITTNSFNENDTAFWEAGQKILAGIKRGIILLILFFVPDLARIIEPFTTEPAKFFRTVFWDSMNTREKIGHKRGDMVDTWLSLKNGEQIPQFKFEDDNLLAQAVGFYVAGFEATSTAIAFALFELACHPEYENRLYKEIQDVVGHRGLTMETINEMPFLDAVVNEALRLYPPLPVIDRVPVNDYKLPGTDLILEKDIPVYVSINGTNRDSRYFSNPGEFNPLRTKDTYDIPDSLAFGIGPRSCIGQRMGLLITKAAIVTIVRNYSLVYRLNKDNIFNPITVFTNAADGVHVQLRKRINK